MRIERKKEIRSLIRVIPQLIKSGLIHQAFDTEKIIASTFDFSDDFVSKLVGMPQNYIEAIQEIYTDIMNRAYSTGFKSAEIKISSTPLNLALPSEELSHEIEIRMPIAFGVKTQLVEIFREGVAQYFETIPDGLEKTMLQFEKDLNCTYIEGVKDFLGSMESNSITLEDKVEDKKEELETPRIEPTSEISIEIDKQELAVDATAKVASNLFVKYATKDLKKLFDLQASEGRHKANAKMIIEFSEWLSNKKRANDYIPDETYRVVASSISKDLLQKLEKYAKLLGEGEAEKVLRFTLGLGPKTKKATAAKAKEEDNEEEEKEEKEVIEDNTYAKFEAYTKLLKNPEAERVLRYTLGLPPKSKITASYQAIARQIGPYDSQALSNKVQNLVDSHDYTPDKSQTIIVECLVADMNKMNPMDAATAIAEKLAIVENPEQEITLDSVERVADSIASQLNVATNLPGRFMFLTTPEGDFCLLYNFTKEEKEDEAIEYVEEDEEYLSMASLPNNPQGVLTKKEQNEIENLLKLGKSKTYKDIKKASPTLAIHVGKVLNDIRMSKLSLNEGLNKLKSNMEDFVTDCFGTDGQEYYKYLRNK